MPPDHASEALYSGGSPSRRARACRARRAVRLRGAGVRADSPSRPSLSAASYRLAFSLRSVAVRTQSGGSQRRAGGLRSRAGDQIGSLTGRRAAAVGVPGVREPSAPRDPDARARPQGGRHRAGTSSLGWSLSPALSLPSRGHGHSPPLGRAPGARESSRPVRRPPRAQARTKHPPEAGRRTKCQAPAPGAVQPGAGGANRPLSASRTRNISSDYFSDVRILRPRHCNCMSADCRNGI
jgi:hypothetical protein